MALQPRGGTTSLPVELTVAVAGTAVGSNAQFALAPAYLSIRSTLDCFVATTSAGTGVAGDGTTAGRRVFVGANERRDELPWGSTGLWVVNANSAELPKVRAEGYS